MIEDEDEGVDVLWSIDFDPFVRNVSVHIHSATPMTAEAVLYELSRIVVSFEQDPEKFLDENTANIIEPQ